MTRVSRTYHREEDVEQNRTQACQDEQMGLEGDGKSDLAKDMSLTLLDWTDPKSLAGQSDQNLIDVIRKGKGKMPPEDAARATNDEVKNMVLYIRKFAKEGSAPAAAPAEAPAPAPATTPAPAPAATTAAAPSR